MMLVKDIQKILESWAPPELALERDAVGLQVGSPDQRVRKILVALDVTKSVFEEARRTKTDLVISHHPLFFQPLRSLRDDDRVGELLLKLARHQISLYAAHTNLDFARSGVSSVLAERFGLTNLAVLRGQTEVYKKIAVYVPAGHVENVRGAMAHAGGGHIGNYDTCSFQTEGTGTFRGTADAVPFIGTVGVLERVREIRLEMLVPKWKVRSVVAAMRSAHPYEEVAYDVYNLANESHDCGAGIIGELQRPTTLKAFLGRVGRALHVPTLRFTGDLRQKVRCVAVCGGSGSDLLRCAVHQGGDTFVTSDVKYHAFEEAEGIIALVDAGHFETEVPVVRKLVDYLKNELAIRGRDVRVMASKQSRNPVKYYLS